MSALVVEAVSRNFGGVQALSNVSFTVEPGERRLIIGPNGAGKTTLFNMVSGAFAVSDGRITLNLIPAINAVLARISLYEVAANARLEVEHAAYPIEAQVSGRVVKNYLALGQHVTAGQLLVELDDASGRAGTAKLKDQVLPELVKLVHVVNWPEGVKDANDFFLSRDRAGQASADFEALLKAAHPQAEQRSENKPEPIQMTPEGFVASYAGRKYDVRAIEKPSASRLKATVRAVGEEGEGRGGGSVGYAPAAIPSVHTAKARNVRSRPSRSSALLIGAPL